MGVQVFDSWHNKRCVYATAALRQQMDSDKSKQDLNELIQKNYKKIQRNLEEVLNLQKNKAKNKKQKKSKKHFAGKNV